MGIGIALGGCAEEPVTGASRPDSAHTDPGAKPDTNDTGSYDHNDETSDFGATHADGREVYINVTQASYVMTAKQG